MMKTLIRNIQPQLTFFARSLSTISASSHVAIIGCTPASLTLALKLRQLGKKVTLIEKKSSIAQCARQINYKGSTFYFESNYFGFSVSEHMKNLKVPIAFMPDRHGVSFYNYPLLNIPFDWDETYNPNIVDGQSSIYGPGKNEAAFIAKLQAHNQYLLNPNIIKMLRVLFTYSIDETLKTTNKYDHAVTLTTPCPLSEILEKEIIAQEGTIKFNTKYIEHFPVDNKKQIILSDLKKRSRFNLLTDQIIDFSSFISNNPSSLPSLSTALLFISLESKDYIRFKDYHHIAFFPANSVISSTQILNEELPIDSAFPFRLWNTSYLNKDKTQKTLLCYIPIPMAKEKGLAKEKHKIINHILSTLQLDKKIKSENIDLYLPSELKQVFGIDSKLSQTILTNAMPTLTYNWTRDIHYMLNNSLNDSEKTTFEIDIGIRFSKQDWVNKLDNSKFQHRI